MLVVGTLRLWKQHKCENLELNTGRNWGDMCVIIKISFLIIYIFLISYVCNYFFSQTIWSIWRIQEAGGRGGEFYPPLTQLGSNCFHSPLCRRPWAVGAKLWPCYNRIRAINDRVIMRLQYTRVWELSRLTWGNEVDVSSHPMHSYFQMSIPDLAITWTDCNLWIAVSCVIFNPLYWNLVSKLMN